MNRHDQNVSEYSWPEASHEDARRIQAAWPATCQALPIGTTVTGTVIGRQRFGVFLQLDGVPDAIGLCELNAMPPDAELPDRGTRLTGEVIWHADHNHQVKIRIS